MNWFNKSVDWKMWRQTNKWFGQRFVCAGVTALALLALGSPAPGAFAAEQPNFDEVHAGVDLKARPTPARTNATAHWAFQPPRAVIAPKVSQENWPQTPVDRFILNRLEQTGLKPAPPAERRILLRRAAYDLTGLPPTAEETAAFAADNSPNAFARVVDRLLESPHYGERWGRIWLDIARYSDTKGYIYDREEKRFVHAHVYRDWVIQALNRDLPYDQFLIAQIAGEQLSASPGESSPLAALGFLTVGRRFLGVKHDIIDDRIDLLTRGTMGLTVACARCHDHKFDPISMRDYYSLYGVFNSSTEQMVPIGAPRPGVPAYDEFMQGLRERQEKLQTTYQKKRAALTERLRARAGEYLRAVLEVDKLPSEEFYAIMSADDLNPVVVRQWESFLFKAKREADPVWVPWHAYSALPAKEFTALALGVTESLGRSASASSSNPLVLELFRGRPPNSMAEVAERYGTLLTSVDKTWRQRQAASTNSSNSTPRPPEPLEASQEQLRQLLYGPGSPASVPAGAIVDIEWFFDEGTRVELTRLQAEIDRWIIRSPGAPAHALILADRPEPRNARLFLRGNPANPGDEAPRRFLEALSRPGRGSFQHGSGRLELAQAIASSENPLTARVMVNRVWQQHFGAGLVRTPSDFGVRAEAPSHPELLDWLALRFIRDGWSLKQLHRLIMNSAVYQQSSEPEPPAIAAGQQRDPANRLLWRMNQRRLDFEGMRDALLAVTGELDGRMGGLPSELFPSAGPARRAVYGYLDRQFVPGVMRVFDFANPDLHIPQRSDTTVPQQALFFMNSAWLMQRARDVARQTSVTEKPARDATATQNRIQQLYQRLYQRDPSSTELQAGVDFINSALVEPPPAPAPVVATAWQYGYGAFDAGTARITSFRTLPHFTGDAWQGGAQWPDAALGWVQLTAEGGHAGNDLAHAAIRRWVAPRDATIAIDGTVRHEHAAGDGIVARIVSSRSGLLGEWTLHETNAAAKVARLEVKRGETIDFVVDFRATLNSDMFKWAPTVQSLHAEAASALPEWSAKKEFTGPPPPPPAPLSSWEKYAQVLLSANEFLFVD